MSIVNSDENIDANSQLIVNSDNTSMTTVNSDEYIDVNSKQ